MGIHVQQFFKKCFPISDVLEAYSERLQTYGFLFSSSPLGITHSKSLFYCQSVHTILANRLGQAAFTTVKT